MKLAIPRPWVWYLKPRVTAAATAAHKKAETHPACVWAKLTVTELCCSFGNSLSYS